MNRTLDAIISERKAIAGDTSAARALIRRQVLPHLDARRAARYVLGTHWAGASPEQRDRFTDAFTRQMVRTYAAVLHEYIDRIVSFAR
ncbi:MAG TPA: ABC transporter substrate-binding protein, partial [Gammaproteobacteria bacterium]|nr:ABC transporter substrate-binding protein [Gammaproteobacteria bacterium]